MIKKLFRGKRVDNGEWVVGDGIHYPKSHNYIGTCWIDGMREKANDWVQVIPETVGQCSFVPDKNGNMMFEDDIVTGLFLYGQSIKATVRLYNGSFGLCWMRGEVKHFDAFTSMINVEYEIIGNIFDNPKALEV